MNFSTMTKIFLATVSMSTAMGTYADIEQSGTVKLQGTIYSATCTITVNDQLLGDGTPIVNMGRYSTGAFGDAGSLVGGSGANGELKVTAINCPDSGTVNMKFSGTPVATDPHMLALDNDGGKEAKNIGIKLFKGTNIANPLELNTVYTYNLTGDNKEYTQDFRAAYQSTADTVTAGTANATMNVDVEYK